MYAYNSQVCVHKNAHARVNAHGAGEGEALGTRLAHNTPRLTRVYGSRRPTGLWRSTKTEIATSVDVKRHCSHTASPQSSIDSLNSYYTARYDENISLYPATGLGLAAGNGVQDLQSPRVHKQRWRYNFY